MWLRSFIGDAFRQALMLSAFTRAVVWLRHLYFVRLRRQLKRAAAADHIIAYDYSRRNVDRLNLKGRPLRLIRPLSVIEALPRNGRILSIGCRYEEEIFYLFAYGYSLRNIRGFDLFSYSPRVDTGDMHEMPYPDSTWDGVICAYTLSYSADPARACSEMIRVTKRGGVIALCVGYYPTRALEDLKEAGKLIGDIETRIQTTDAILKLFSPHVDKIYFQHDPAFLETPGMCGVIFSVRK
jgi:SAM-dependent methyltransferase